MEFEGPGGHTDIASTEVDGLLGGIPFHDSHDGGLCGWLRGIGEGNGEERIDNPILGMC